jgi:hypothetical protein
MNVHLAVAGEVLTTLIGGAEWQEGMTAFVEKRPPTFLPLQGEHKAESGVARPRTA